MKTFHADSFHFGCLNLTYIYVNLLDVVSYRGYISTNVSVAFWIYLPFLVQAPMRLTTLGWSPTLTMIFSSFKRSRFSSVVAFSAKQKNTGNGINIIGMYDQNCLLKDGTPLTGVKKSQELNCGTSL